MSERLKEVLEPNQPKYLPGAWEDWEPKELLFAVHFFAKRATHRANVPEILKDLKDSENYGIMLRERLVRLADERLEREEEEVLTPEERDNHVRQG